MCSYRNIFIIGRVNALTQALIELRVFVEATIDFSDEEIDFLASGAVKHTPFHKTKLIFVDTLLWK
jgi:tRNA U34 5-carboxymethylaminomethyl modifying GTPase MnmE/TrmE